MRGLQDQGFRGIYRVWGVRLMGLKWSEPSESRVKGAAKKRMAEMSVCLFTRNSNHRRYQLTLLKLLTETTTKTTMTTSAHHND